MAPEDDKTTIQGGEAAATTEAAKKGPNKLILFGGIGVGVIVIGVLLALFVLKPMMAGSGGDSAQIEQADHGSDDSNAKSNSHGSGEGNDGASQSLVYAVKDIVVNPAGTGGTRFLSVSFGFELGSQELETQFRDREPIVRDALITILSSKTVAQLTDAKQKEIARYQIKKRLQQLLNTEEINGVYYTDFVLQ